jgi:hypothetical protein
MPLSFPQILSAVKAHFGATPKTSAEIVAMLNGTTPAPSPAVTEADVNQAIVEWKSAFPDADSAKDAATLMTRHPGARELLKRAVVANLDRGMLISFIFGAIFCFTVFGFASLGVQFRGSPAQPKAAEEKDAGTVVVAQPKQDELPKPDRMSDAQFQEEFERLWKLPESIKRDDGLRQLLDQRLGGDPIKRDEEFRHSFSQDR